MNNKGFTLVEMLVSFVIMSVIVGIMMNVLFTIKDRSEKSQSLTQLSVMQANLSKLIKNDLNNDTLESLESCGTNCYEFTYTTLGVKQLSLDTINNKITYGSYTKVLPDGGVLGSPLVLQNSIVEEITSGNDSILKIKIPITNIYNDNDFNITIIFQYDSDLIYIEGLTSLPPITTYQYQQILTIDSTKIGEVLTNFPVTVNLNSSNFDFSKAKSDGSDIKFLDSNNNLLAFEKEYYTSSETEVNPTYGTGSNNTVDNGYNYLYVGSSLETRAYYPDIDNGDPATYYEGNHKDPRVLYDVAINLPSAVSRSNGTHPLYDYIDTIYAGTNTFNLSHTFDSTEWVVMQFGGSSSTTAGYVGNFKMNINGTLYTLQQAVTNGYIEPLVPIGSSSSSSGYLMNDCLNIYSGGNPSASNYAKLFIFFKLKSGYTTNQVQFYANKNYPTSSYDGFRIYSVDEDEFRLSITSAPIGGNNGVFHVKVPSVSATVDTIIKMQYGYEEATNLANPENVWDSNYVMVQHMGSSLLDSTFNNNDGTNYGTAIVNGPVGKARRFVKEENDYVGLTNNNLTTVGGLNDGTITAVVNIDSLVLDYTNVILSYRGSGFNNSLQFQIDDATGDLVYDVYPPLDWPSQVTSVITADQNTFVASRMAANGTKVVLTVNNSDYQFLNPEVYSGSAPTSFDIGRDSYGGNSMDGIIDEVRISNIERSSAWVKAEYYSLFNTLLTYGTRQNL